MKTKAITGIVLTLFLASIVGFIAPVSATSVIDQQQTVINTELILAIGGLSEQKLAQVVTAGLTGVLTEVRFPVACSQDSDLIVEIQGVSEGKPDGAVLTSETIPWENLPPTIPATFRSLGFSNPVSFSAGDQFAIVLYSTGSCGVYPGPVDNPYPGGDAFFDARPNPPGVWLSTSIGYGIYDLPFQTLVMTTELAIQDLIDLVDSMNLPHGIDNSLDAKLTNALAALEAANAGLREDAVNKLNAFINGVEAQRENKITNEQADQLIAATQVIISLIG